MNRLDGRNALFRSLPAMHELLGDTRATDLMALHGRYQVKRALQTAIDEIRESLSGENGESQVGTPLTDSLLQRAQTLLQLDRKRALQKVLNLTGVVLHTNLGRAPLSDAAVRAVTAVASGYSNLEYDLVRGERGLRHQPLEALLTDLTGAEAAMVVNNNAAAVWLILKELAEGGQGLVSRGELVEIGGSFRISEIMGESGVELVEVGTTNKTRLSDYQRAFTPDSKLVIRVHTSNFRIVGFTERPTLQELCRAAHEAGLLIYEDLGSGALYDLQKRGIGDEPVVKASIEAGVDVVSFSGDKLLGGAQAGIIAGKRSVISRLAKNQLARALRVDKLTLAALQATLEQYRLETEVASGIPVIRMLTEDIETLRRRAQAIRQRLVDALPQRLTETDETVEAASLSEPIVDFAVRDVVSRVGGGALPTEELPSAAVVITSGSSSLPRLFTLLRTHPDVPVIGRMESDAIVLDVRTLLPGEEDLLIEGVSAAVAKLGADAMHT